MASDIFQIHNRVKQTLEQFLPELIFQYTSCANGVFYTVTYYDIDILNITTEYNVIIVYENNSLFINGAPVESNLVSVILYRSYQNGICSNIEQEYLYSLCKRAYDIFIRGIYRFIERYNIRVKNNQLYINIMSDIENMNNINNDKKEQLCNTIIHRLILCMIANKLN